MPYITKQRRNDIDQGWLPNTAGELNYQITKIILEYLEDRGERYQTYNDIIGALECAKLELYRRKVIGYENVKKIQNGDVYD